MSSTLDLYLAAGARDAARAIEIAKDWGDRSDHTLRAIESARDSLTSEAAGWGSVRSFTPAVPAPAARIEETAAAEVSP
jgi:hypothetical protein